MFQSMPNSSKFFLLQVFIPYFSRSMHFSALSCIPHAHLFVLLYDHPNNFWRMCIIKVLIRQFPSASCYLILLKFSIFSSSPWVCSLSTWPSFTPKKYNRQNYSLVYLNLFLDSGYKDKRFKMGAAQDFATMCLGRANYW